jgi:hypothetical protein
MFVCRYSGTVDGKEYGFRKCYARGCPDERCPATSRAVMTANQHMKMDFHRLRKAGIQLERPQLILESYDEEENKQNYKVKIANESLSSTYKLMKGK